MKKVFVPTEEIIKEIDNLRTIAELADKNDYRDGYIKALVNIKAIVMEMQETPSPSVGENKTKEEWKVEIEEILDDTLEGGSGYNEGSVYFKDKAAEKIYELISQFKPSVSLPSEERIKKEIKSGLPKTEYGNGGYYYTNGFNDAVKWLSSYKGENKTSDTLEFLFEKHQEFAKNKFPKSTWESSLRGLEREIKEVELAHSDYLVIDGSENKEKLGLEYIDCFMYLLDSAKRAGFNVGEIKKMFKNKLEINLNREWKLNIDGSYSHIK